jgi:hypothetical protein
VLAVSEVALFPGKIQIVVPPPPLASRVDLAQPLDPSHWNFKFSPILDFTAVVEELQNSPAPGSHWLRFFRLDLGA